MDHIRPTTTGPIRSSLILLHGDAAFAGQGWWPRRLAMSQTGYRVGGTVHIVVGNQARIHHTTGVGPVLEYCTDIACPYRRRSCIVNGDDPKPASVAWLAFAYRQGSTRTW